MSSPYYLFQIKPSYNKKGNITKTTPILLHIGSKEECEAFTKYDENDGALLSMPIPEKDLKNKKRMAAICKSINIPSIV